MQRQELIRKINEPPALKIGVRLARFLASEPETEKPCLNPGCFNFHFNEKYCSRACGNTVRGRSIHLIGARVAGDKRRGSNPNRHISKRVNGKLVYLHRYIVEQELGVKLADDEIVHHRDGNKHHNCFWKSVNACLFEHSDDMPNLEILTGEARREHIARHQEQLQRARKAKRK